MTEPVGFGVIGARSFVANAAVLPAIDAGRDTVVVATASNSGDVPARWAATQVEGYDAVLEHPGVDVVYIPLPNGMHREWTERAAAAGKHVLCEKPLAADTATAFAMAEACADAGVLLGEAWMTPFDRRWATTIELARTGAVGPIDGQFHRFTFTIGPEASDNYRWDPAQGGGALLDVGIYCVGTAVELWGPEAEVVGVERRMTTRGVDASTVADLAWAEGRQARMVCSFVDDEYQQASFHGPDGMLMLERAAFTSGDPLDHVVVRSSTGGGDVSPIDLALHADPSSMADGSVVEQFSIEPGNPYQRMIEAFADAVRGRREWPRPVGRSIELLALLERIARFGDQHHE